MTVFCIHRVVVLTDALDEVNYVLVAARTSTYNKSGNCKSMTNQSHSGTSNRVMPYLPIRKRKNEKPLSYPLLTEVPDLSGATYLNFYEKKKEKHSEQTRTTLHSYQNNRILS